MSFESENLSPAIIHKSIMDILVDSPVNDNLQIVIDFHWFFLQSRRHKAKSGLKNYSGKWKYYAASADVFMESVFNLVPLVASGELPLVKFTNVANVFTGEKEIVAYCFPSGPAKAEAESILAGILGDGIVWGE